MDSETNHTTTNIGQTIERFYILWEKKSFNVQLLLKRQLKKKPNKQKKVRKSKNHYEHEGNKYSCKNKKTWAERIEDEVIPRAQAKLSTVVPSDNPMLGAAHLFFEDTAVTLPLEHCVLIFMNRTCNEVVEYTKTHWHIPTYRPKDSILSSICSALYNYRALQSQDKRATQNNNSNKTMEQHLSQKCAY